LEQLGATTLFPYWNGPESARLSRELFKTSSELEDRG
jgi:hypothetical protein